MAKRVEVSVDHALAREAARERMAALGEYYTNRYGATVTWLDDYAARVQAKYLMVKLDVRVDVGGSSVSMEAPDPGRLLRNKMVGYIERKLRYYLDPANEASELARS